MIVEIDDDCADQITQQVLLDTYVNLKRDLKIATKDPSIYHPDDVENWAKVVVAIEALGDWYFVNFKESVKQKKGSKK